VLPYGPQFAWEHSVVHRIAPLIKGREHSARAPFVYKHPIDGFDRFMYPTKSTVLPGDSTFHLFHFSNLGTHRCACASLRRGLGAQDS
jgi:hypothetical protein